MSIEYISTNRANGGLQHVVKHTSRSTNTGMTLSVFVPDHKPNTTLPVLWYLSGLTCTHANVTEKGEYRKACAEHGIIFIAPDTSPRGEDVPDDSEQGYDFGLGAGFYVNATQAPFDVHYKMRDYIENELPSWAEQHFPVNLKQQSIMGHSMGGHGALTIGLRNPDKYKSISAFSPIVSPMQCAWGEKALTGYLGSDKSLWRDYDACALIEDRYAQNGGNDAKNNAKNKTKIPPLLVDQGTGDNFLDNQLKTYLLSEVLEKTEQSAEIRMQRGYDHSYYFISSFMPEHIAWHASRLKN